MQTRGVFPELNSGYKSKPKARRNSGTFSKADKGCVGFDHSGPSARNLPRNPASLSGRRDASHRKARG